MVVRCPIKTCPNHKAENPSWIIRKGFFKTNSGNRVQKYQCGACGKFFSDQTFALTYRERKPDVNREIFKWYCSAATQRRMAKNLGIARKTVERKFVRLSKRAREIHNHKLKCGALKSSYILFDEMESYIHSRLKPTDIAIAVRNKTGEILEISVSTLNCRLNLQKQKKKYPLWANNCAAARENVLIALQHCKRTDTTIGTDKNNSYVSIMNRHGFKHKFLKKKRTWDKTDPMGKLNHVCAKIRADLSRMRRRTWITSKSLQRLQMHLDLYIAYNNGYELT